MKRCTLCGGKLDHEKRCTLCGLDNTKNDSMYTHMINKNDCEDVPLTHVHEETEPKKVKERPARGTYRTPQYGKNITPKKVKKSGCATLISIIPLIIAIIGLLGNIIGDGFYEIEPEYSIEEETLFDPYAWVIEEMPEYGDTSDMYLEAGIYEVGHHVPMGTYQIDIISENAGTVEVYDEWNEIYLSEFLDPYSDNSTMTDVMLFDGAYLVVYPGVEVTLNTENAQPIVVYGTLNESQEPVDLNGELVTGEDFEAGAYNIVYKPVEGEYSFVNIMVMPKDKDYGFYITFDSDMEEEVFYNLPLPEKAVIVVEEDYLEGVESLYLVPSEITSDTDLECFYNAY